MPEAHCVAHSARSDDELIAAVARERDPQAFAGLFERHKNALYALAWHITRQRDAADEAVQEAMLRLWNAAGRYQPGHARAYLLKIVAREAIRIQGRRRSESCMDTREEGAGKASPLGELERAEAHAALRQALAHVPEDDRKIVVLACAGGMSHQDIGELLSIPRRTVSNRVQGALERLRGELARAGFSTLAVGAGAAELQEAMLSGPAAPDSLLPRMIERLARRPSARARTRAPSSAIPKPLLLASLAACAVVAALIFAPKAGPAPQPRAVEAPQAAAKPPGPQPVPATRTPYFREWAFEAPGDAADFEVLDGGWEFAPAGGEGKSGGMRTTAPVTRIAIPLGTARLPVLVTVRVSPVRDNNPGPYDVGLGGIFTGQSAEVHWPHDFFWVRRKNAWSTVHTYISERAMDQWLRGSRVHLILGKFHRNSGSLNFSVKGLHLIGKVSVQEIDPAEVPEFAEFSSSLEKLPAPERNGRMAAPGLPDTWFQFHPPEPPGPLPSE